MKKRALLLLLVVTALVLACSFGASAEVIDSGSCGANVTWTYEEDANHPENGGALTIAGKGKMDDYTAGTEVPWASYRNYIGKVVFKDGVTHVGDYAFEGLSDLVVVSLSDTVTSIGKCAFYNCESLTILLIPPSVTLIADDIVGGLEYLLISSKPGSLAEEYADVLGYSFVPYFDDVKNAGSYYFLPVFWARLCGIVNGVDENHFAPDKPCSRAEFVTILYRAITDGEAEISGENPFKDVKEDAYYRDAVVWASQYGITAGTSPTTFEPNRICSRAEIVTFLFRIACIAVPEEDMAAFLDEYGDQPFVDVKDGDFYRDAVVFAAATGITTGTDDTHFSPKMACSRGQVVTFLFRFYMIFD